MQVSVKQALRYTVRGKHRRVLIRRLGVTAESPTGTPTAGSVRKRRLRLGLGGALAAAGGSGLRKRRAAGGRLGGKPRAKAAKLPPQIYCTEFCRCLIAFSAELLPDRRVAHHPPPSLALVLICWETLKAVEVQIASSLLKCRATSN